MYSLAVNMSAAQIAQVRLTMVIVFVIISIICEGCCIYFVPKLAFLNKLQRRPRHWYQQPLYWYLPGLLFLILSNIFDILIITNKLYKEYAIFSLLFTFLIISFGLFYASMLLLNRRIHTIKL
ncbi:hypothetical protein [Dictyobacter arantiisoli]|uniref:Uncharacterized protein n=1 Tax=Dictyobacter arantiisoli TaxID=2014874 RepID=A0A5A5T7E1_9CHLR|nr:hypothetical protein [Dictyobacter arantiisoli]GCF06844.1 hypothetical protein KDI_04080 [Dictyobacter arantiisoli]